MTALAMLLIGGGVVSVVSGIRGYDVRDVFRSVLSGAPMPPPRYTSGGPVRQSDVEFAAEQERLRQQGLTGFSPPSSTGGTGGGSSTGGGTGGGGGGGGSWQ